MTTAWTWLIVLQRGRPSAAATRGGQAIIVGGGYMLQRGRTEAAAARDPTVILTWNGAMLQRGRPGAAAASRRLAGRGVPVQPAATWAAGRGRCEPHHHDHADSVRAAMWAAGSGRSESSRSQACGSWRPNCDVGGRERPLRNPGDPDRLEQRDQAATWAAGSGRCEPAVRRHHRPRVAAAMWAAASGRSVGTTPVARTLGGDMLQRGGRERPLRGNGRRGARGGRLLAATWAAGSGRCEGSMKTMSPAWANKGVCERWPAR